MPGWGGHKARGKDLSVFWYLPVEFVAWLQHPFRWKASWSLELGLELLWQIHILCWGETEIIVTKNLTWNAKRSSIIPVIVVKRRNLFIQVPSESSNFAGEWVHCFLYQKKREMFPSPSLCNVERIEIYRRESLFFDWTLNIYIPFELAVMLLAEKLCKSEGVHWIINQGIHPAKYIRALWSRWKNAFLIWKRIVCSALVPDWC